MHCSRCGSVSAASVWSCDRYASIGPIADPTRAWICSLMNWKTAR